MIDLSIIFVMGFVQVFALGFQSRNVNTGRYGWAAATSFAIGISQGFVWAGVAAGGGLSMAALVYACSGACAIPLSMWVHKRYIGEKRS